MFGTVDGAKDVLGNVSRTAANVRGGNECPLVVPVKESVVRVRAVVERYRRERIGCERVHDIAQELRHTRRAGHLLNDQQIRLQAKHYLAKLRVARRGSAAGVIQNVV